MPAGRGKFSGNVYQAPPLIFVSKRVTVVAQKVGGKSSGRATAEVLLNSAHSWIVGLSLFWGLVCGLIVMEVVSGWPTEDVPKPPEVVVGPAIVTLKPGDSQQFIASGDVNWGDLPGGVYQAPASPPEPGEVMVVHPRSGDSPVPEGSITVIRSNDISLALNPPYAILKPGERQRFEVLKLPGTAAEGQDLALLWSDAELGDMNSETAIYTAPAAAAIRAPKTILVTVRTKAPERVAAARVVLLPNYETPTQLVWVVLLFGALGASLHGVSSLVDYVGNRTFKSSWGLYYLARPFVGATLALLVFLVFRSDLDPNPSSPDAADFYAVAAVAGLVGLFAEKATKKLEAIVGVLFGQSDTRSDKLTAGGATAAPKIDSVDPSTLPKGGAAITVTLQGSNFAAGLTAQVNGKPRPCTFDSVTSVKVSLEQADLATGGTLKIKVKLSSGEESNEVSVDVK